MHYRSCLGPHSISHRFFRFIMNGIWLPASGLLFGFRCAHGNIRRIWSTALEFAVTFVVWITLWVLASCTTQSNTRETVDKITGFLLYGFAFMLFRRSCQAVIAA